MSSRFPPPSGFNSRDRSPQRFGDRRPPAGPRGPDDGSPSFGREPPRGPRALVDSPRGAPFGGGRGRGYVRGDFRDRERDFRDRDRDRDFRDTRDPLPFRRDLDRDWGRRDRDFDPRDTRIGFGRGRSRSPTRDYRDLRDPAGRDFDLVRMRRNSRDSLLSASSGGPDAPLSSGFHSRGGSMRGRGRGDRDGGRGRGRPLYLDDREPFRRRSRSRDIWRDRGRDRLPDRDRDRDLERDRLLDRDRDRGLDRDRDIRDRDWDRDIDRRDRYDRTEDWETRWPDCEDRERPIEPWKRDRPSSRADSRGLMGLTTSANIPHSTLPHIGPASSDRLPDQTSLDQNRKFSTPSGAPGLEVRRDSDRSEQVPIRHDPTKDFGPIGQHSPPPSAPQVPAFGSFSAPIPALSSVKVSNAERYPSIDVSIQPRTGIREGQGKQPARPPTGPRADRSDPAQPTDIRDHASDAGRPQEEPVRTARASTHLSDRSPPTAPAAMVRQDSIFGTGEHRASKRNTSVSASPTSTRLPPPASRALSREPSISPRMSSSSIPTAPRAFQQQRPGVSSRYPNKGTKQWAVSDTGGRVPSFSNAPLKRAIDDEDGSSGPHDKIHQPSRLVSLNQSSEFREPNVTTAGLLGAGFRSSSATTLPIRSSPPPASTFGSSSRKELEKAGNAEASLIPDFEPSSEEEDEATSVFNQEYLEERKRTFEKDMQYLRSELPMSPLQDPTIVALLWRIQLLGAIAHEEFPGPPTLASLHSVEDDDPSNVIPKERVVTVVAPDLERETGPALQTPTLPVASQPAITVESLPFLSTGPLTPLSDLEICQENASSQVRLQDTFRNELSRRQKQIARKNADLRERYMAYYKPWRLAVWELDRLKEKKSMTPSPASPPPAPTASTPAPAAESREGRRYKGNSELDFLNALKASEISAQEELERRRTRMATARPDLAREAVIPDMLEPREEKASLYKDVNNAVDPNEAMAIFGFQPPPNDFTKEEHVIFTDAFMAHPKKWGKIAEALPGRDFQQCIIHYYLTKEEIKYKAKLNKRWSRRGRGKAKSSRPKSNALIADLGVVKPDFDGEEEPAPVTDTGRPRRAAAPTFGDSNEPESTGNARRGQTGKDGELVEKAPPRRGGRTSGVRGPRRTKTTQQDPKGSGQPSQGSAPLVTAPKMEASIEGVVEGVLPQDRGPPEKDVNPPIPRSRAGRTRVKEGMYVFETTEAEPVMTPKQLETGYGSLQPTSYWSVPEQRDFPRLLGHFGRDFEGISNFMKTKTTVMVKNYYQRRLDSGQKDFEDIVLMAEEQKSRGEPTAPLPVPSLAPKRRYEATPSAIVPRPLAPHGDPITEAEEARFSSKSKALAMSPQPMPTHNRHLPDNDRIATRYPPLAQASPAASAPPLAATLIEEASRAMRSQPATASHRMQGPRLGYFTDDRRESAMLPHSTPRAQESTIHSRHPPGATISSEMHRIDPLSSQTYMSGQPPPALLPPTHSRHPSLTQPPGSPPQFPRPELEILSVHRDPYVQRQYYPLPGQPIALSQSPRPVLSPVKDVGRTGAAETSRQVPAKRSNIMSILNDEPEEPQPRKRFASEQTSSAPVSSSTPPAQRSTYSSVGSARSEETAIVGAAQKASSYSQQNHYQTPSRGYAEFSSYGPPGGSGASVNNDWMARFDPRAPQTASQPQTQAPPQQSSRSTTTVTSQSPFSQYASTQSHSSGPINHVPVASSATTQPLSSQRPSYASVFSQPNAVQVVPSPGARELHSQPSAYRPGSPTPRASSVAFGSRQEPPTAAQSSTTLLGMPPRSVTHSSYASGTPPTPVPAQPHNQSYQQHVQTLVNGSHQSHRSATVSLPGGPPQFGHRTPPPQAQGGRSIPPLTTIGRSYTPPSALHPTANGIGMGYAPPPPAGTIPPLHQKPPGPGTLGESTSTPGHHRVYSQGSVPSGLPGPIHPSSQPPR